MPDVALCQELHILPEGKKLVMRLIPDDIHESKYKEFL